MPWLNLPLISSFNQKGVCRKKWVGYVCGYGEHVADIKMEWMMLGMINGTYEKYSCKCNPEFTTLTTILMCNGREQRKVH